MDRILICVTIFLCLFHFYHCNNNIAYNIPDPECTGVFNLCTDADKERLGREAVKAIHEQMDDDKDGMIEASESTDFIKEELESKTDSIRHRHFQTADLHISYDDLWKQWQKSAVYNWTTDNVVDWLVNYVNLPMYVDNFRRNQFDGRMIPRIATNEKHYLSGIMQIRDPRHKRRLVIKATDVVLFGPPQRVHNLIKDMILISAVLISLGACLYAFFRHRQTQDSMKILLKELETLQKAEADLVAVTGQMKAMENEMKEKPKVDRGLLNSWSAEVQKTKNEAENYRKRRNSTADHDKQLRLAVQEIEQLRIALRKAEEHAQHQSYEPPSELIDLLKRTYHTEETAFEGKRKSAENAMLSAKEQLGKISKMQKGFFGAVRIAHTGCMDDISELISSAKERLADVQDDFEERERRWNRIASLLDREDLVSNSSSSTTSTGGNQYLIGGTMNGMNSNTSPSDSYNRSKQPSLDSGHLINTSFDSTSMNKSNSNLNTRGIPINSIKTSSQDLLNPSENNSEYNNSPSSIVKRRTFTNHTLTSNRFSSDRLSLNPRIVYSHSTNGLSNSTGMTRPSPNDISDLLSTNKQSRPIFDIAVDPQDDNNDYLADELETKSQISESAYDGQQSISSPEKKRKQFLSSKFLKPFHNMRSRKKSNVS